MLYFSLCKKDEDTNIDVKVSTSNGAKINLVISYKEYEIKLIKNKIPFNGLYKIDFEKLDYAFLLLKHQNNLLFYHTIFLKILRFEKKYNVFIDKQDKSLYKRLFNSEIEKIDEIEKEIGLE